MVKVEKYEFALGPFAKKQLFRGAQRKTQWAVSFAEDVEKIRAMVAA